MNEETVVLYEKDFVLQPCSKEELLDFDKKYNLEGFKKYIEGSLPIEGIEKIIHDGIVVGLIDAKLYEDDFESEILTILAFEIFEKRKGLGKLFIEYFLTEIASAFSSVNLYCDEKSVGFWEKTGFISYDENSDFTHQYISGGFSF